MSSPVVASQIVVWERRIERTTGGAKGRFRARNGAFLRLMAADGRVGLGEASPLPGYSQEDLAACVAALRDAHLWCAEQALRELRLRHLPAARFAVETALVDLEAQARGLRAAEILGGATNPTRVPLAGFAGAAVDGEACVRRAEELVKAGLGCLKVKVGAGPFDDELAVLRALRGALGDGVALRLDANQAWSFDEAVRHLDALGAVSPAWVEEPCQPLDNLRLQAPVPLAFDESLTDATFAERVLSEPPPGLAAVVVKPAMLGLWRARALALRALAANLAVVVTHLFDGPVGLAAAAELALSLPNAAAAGLAPHDVLATFQVAVPQVRSGRWLEPSSTPGLGLVWEPA